MLRASVWMHKLNGSVVGITFQELMVRARAELLKGPRRKGRGTSLPLYLKKGFQPLSRHPVGFQGAESTASKNLPSNSGKNEK
jgi:hypothetical protein